MEILHSPITSPVRVQVMYVHSAHTYFIATYQCKNSNKNLENLWLGCDEINKLMKDAPWLQENIWILVQSTSQRTPKGLKITAESLYILKDKSKRVCVNTHHNLIWAVLTNPQERGFYRQVPPIPVLNKTFSNVKTETQSILLQN